MMSQRVAIAVECGRYIWRKIVLNRQMQNEAVFEDTQKRASLHAWTKAVKLSCKDRPSQDTQKIQRVVVVRGDALEVARRLAEIKKSVAVLSFASADGPGGPTKMKGNTQEEQFFRRSNLCMSVTNDLYPIDGKEPSVLRSDTITVFKDLAGNDQTPFQISVLSCVAVRMPAVKMSPDGGREFRHDSDREATETKMRGILEAAKDKDAVVLGAWGLGAYSGPLEGIVSAWKRALAHRRGPATVVFAIMSADKEDESALLKAFRPLGARFSSSAK
jgi:uncharacterized protein (TIGR02452 family)